MGDRERWRAGRVLVLSLKRHWWAVAAVCQNGSLKSPTADCNRRKNNANCLPK